MPDAAYIRAKLREIARHYARKKKRPSIAQLRVRDLNRLLEGRYPNGIPDNPAGRVFVMVMAHHLAATVFNPAIPHATLITRFISDHAPWMPIGNVNELITAAVANPKRWRADRLAWKLHLTDADRSKLKITTIGAIDCSKAQRELRRKAKSRERTRKWRKKQKSAQ